MTDSITPAAPSGSSDAEPSQPTPNFEFPTSDVLVTERKPSGMRSAVEWAVVLVGAVVLALLIKTFVFQVFYIPSASMVPTLEVNDRVAVNKLSYRLHDINRGDIVVFERPENDQANDGVEDLIKRVVALPNESVVIKDDRVYVDGQLLDESYLPPGTVTSNAGTVSCTDEMPCVIGEDEIWVMGDNRGNSKDSRWFGPVDEDTVVGRAAVRLWPLERADLL